MVDDPRVPRGPAASPVMYRIRGLNATRNGSPKCRNGSGLRDVSRVPSGRLETGRDRASQRSGSAAGGTAGTPRGEVRRRSSATAWASSSASSSAASRAIASRSAR